MPKTPKSKSPKQVEALKHEDAKRKNIPTAELQSAAQRMEEMHPAAPVTYERRSPLARGITRPRDGDLDPQMVWKGTRVRLTKEQIKEVTEKGYVDLDEPLRENLNKALGKKWEEWEIPHEADGKWPRDSGSHPVGQRVGVHSQIHPGLAAEAGDQNPVYRAGIAVGERL